METYVIKAGDVSINVLVQRTRSRSKVTYQADPKYSGYIRATVPSLMPPQHIEKFFADNIHVLKELLSRSQESIYMHKFKSGEFVPFFGSNLRLRVTRSDQAKTSYNYEVTSEEFILNLFGEYAADPRVTDDSAFRAICGSELKRRAYEYIDKYESAMGVCVLKLSVRDMKTRWGSIRPNLHSMSLASNLFMYPECCLEAVVVHELAHFKHLNHSQEFYERMTEFMPSWRVADALLDNKSYQYERMDRLIRGECEPPLV